MNPLKRLILLASQLLTLIAASSMAFAADSPVNIIFDTDVDHDCDDIGALYILHGAVQGGEAKLLATIGCTSADAIAPALDAISTWFGRPEIPVGTLKDRGFLDHKGFADDLLEHYPSKFPSGKDYPDAVALSCAVTVTESTLPEGWSYDELNSPPIPGAVVVSGTKFTLTGSGHAMTSWWERVRDQGVFASKAVSGNVQLTAQLTELAPHVGGPTYKWDDRPPTASGLMIRESLDQAAGRYFLVQLEASGSLVCRWRNKTGDQDDNQGKELGRASMPIHLKLSQKGEEIQVFTSADGKDWGEPRMSHSANFGEASRIGIFVCSGNTFASSTAIFEDVALSAR